MNQLPKIGSYSERESALTAAGRVPDQMEAEDATSRAVSAALEPAPLPPPQWPRRVEVSLHESVLVYFEENVEEFGLVRVQTTKNGIELYVGNECRWRSSSRGGDDR